MRRAVFEGKGFENAVSQVSQAILEMLHQLDIPYRAVSHAPAATIADCAAVEAQIGATVCKNYFLTTKNHKIHCLCVTRPNARFHTADISKQAGTSRLSFAGEDEMVELLRTHPGSVSPLGLAFDSAHAVRLLVDRALQDLPELAFHPCDNTQTLALSTRAFFERFLPATGHAPQWVEIHDFDVLET